MPTKIAHPIETITVTNAHTMKFKITLIIDIFMIKYKNIETINNIIIG